MKYSLFEVIFIFTMVYLAVFFSVMGLIYNYKAPLDVKKPIVKYYGLNYVQEFRLDLIINRVQPFFLEPIESIEVYPNSFDLQCGKANFSIAGCNDNGKIKMIFSKYQDELNRVLCHELIHNYIYDENLTKRYDDTEVCFK